MIFAQRFDKNMKRWAFFMKRLGRIVKRLGLKAKILE
jgi:hypothetical protein